MIRKEGTLISQPSPVTVRLSSAEMRVLSEEAERRQRRYNDRSGRWARGISSTALLSGLAAECAVEQLLASAGVPFRSLRESKSPDPGYDIEFWGIRWDVKATQSSDPPRVVLSKHKQDQCDGYIWARYNRDDSVDILGYNTRGEVDGWMFDATKHAAESISVGEFEWGCIRELLSSKPGNSLFRYPGGKSKIIRHLREHLPLPGMFAPEVYIEPFVGGGGSLVPVLQMIGRVSRVIINDLDADLMCAWHAATTNPIALIRALCRVVVSVDTFYRAKKLDGTKTGTPLERAARKIALQRLSHGGIGYMAGGPQGGASQQSNYKVGCRWRIGRIARTILRIARLLRGVEVHCVDFEQLDVPPRSFMFVDPPYFHAGDSLYRHKFTTDDHVRLHKWLMSSDSDWRLTYDDTPEIERLYRGCEMVRVQNYNTNNSVRRRGELLIRM